MNIRIKLNQMFKKDFSVLNAKHYNLPIQGEYCLLSAVRQCGHKIVTQFALCYMTRPPDAQNQAVASTFGSLKPQSHIQDFYCRP